MEKLQKQKKQKKNLLPKNLKTRELTKNEKVLLSLLAAVILIWASFRFIITPQKAKLEALDIQKMEYQGKIDEMNVALKKEAEINNEWDTLNDEKTNIVSKYFPTIDQAQIIYLLNELIEHDDVSVVDLNFNRPTYEDIGGFQVKSMDISIPYDGNYKGIVDIVNSIEKSPRKILVDSLTMDRDAEGELNGNLALKVYSLDGIVEADSNVIAIDTTGRGSKSTPFSKYDDYYVKNEVDSPGSDSSGSDSSGSDSSGSDGSGSDGSGSDGSGSGSSGSGSSGSGSSGSGSSGSGSSGSGSSGSGNSGSGNSGSGSSGGVVPLSPYIEKTLLDFESKNNYFLPSQPLVKGNVMQSTNSKSEKYSLRFEYDILAVEEENRAFIDISKNNITLKYPPNSIGIWLYSYDYSPVTVGIGFKGQMGEDEFVPFTEGIGWTGWKYLEVNPPDNLSIYPLKLDKLYVDMPKDRDDFGVILFDKLEAKYARNLGEDGSDKSASEHIFHVVGMGDTIEKISNLYYGTNKYKNEILELNEMKIGETLHFGKILVLKKR